MNLVKSLFYVPKHGYVSDKTFIANITACIIGVIICLTSLTYVTWAWFSCTVNTGAINMQAANYEISVAVRDKDGDTVTVTENTQNRYTAALSKNGYIVTLKAQGTAKTGYCKIAANGEEYFTSPILSGEELTFELVCYEQIEVSFIGTWGSYSGGNTVTDALSLGMPSGEEPTEN